LLVELPEVSFDFDDQTAAQLRLARRACLVGGHQLEDRVEPVPASDAAEAAPGPAKLRQGLRLFTLGEVLSGGAEKFTACSGHLCE
jgi:hypothetical protein